MAMRRNGRSHWVRKTLILERGALVIQGLRWPAGVWNVEHQRLQQIRHLAFNVKPSVASKRALPPVKQPARGLCRVAQGALCSATPYRGGEGLKREGTLVHAGLIHAGVWQKPT